MAEELMVKVDDVYKRYRLGLIGGGTLTADLQSWWAKVRHKEDPNSKIGAKVYGKNEVFYALNGISFEVRKGEALGIIGGNGAGKSTTLKLLSQVTAPTKGKIYLNGRVASMLEVGTGFHPELTGRENIYLNGAILGMTKAEIDAKIEEIIDFSECRQFIDTPVKRYSSGMYVKLAFSVAAHLDSEIMIMDEVLAVGDVAFQKKCIDKMIRISKEESRAILYVSHNMDTIRRLCDRCIVLNKGKVIFEGDVEKSIEKYIGSNGSAEKSYLYTDSYRRRSSSGEMVKLEGIRTENGKNAVYDCGEKATFIVDMSSKEIIDGVRLRFEISNQVDTKVGTMLSDNDINFTSIGRKQIEITIDTKNFVPGKYKLDVVVYISNEYGHEQFLDGVYPGLIMEISDKINKYNSLIWLHNYWGFIHLDDVKVKEIN